jgi:RNA polymerase sigma factor (sigma-70 family)
MNKSEEELILEFQKSGKISYDLIKINEGIINLVINRYFKSYKNDREDLFQEGILGLLDAFEKYSPEKSAGFFSYKVLWVRNKIQLYVRKNLKDKFSLLSDQNKNVHLANSTRSEKIKALFDLVRESGRLSESERFEILFAIKNVKLGFLKSKTFLKLKNIMYADQ